MIDRRAFCLAATLWNAAGITANAELLVDLTAVVARRSDGIFEYNYVLKNGVQSSQSINSILLSTALNATVLSIAGPSDEWVAAYASRDEVFQAGFATGLSAGGEECGATSEFDVFPGQTVSFSMTSPWGPALQDFAVGRTVGRGTACDFVGDFATGQIFSPSMAIQACDFDFDGSCNLVDMDQLTTAIFEKSQSPIFDLDDDTLVDRTDLGLFLKLVGRSLGDADLNGRVEFADFLALSGNFSIAGKQVAWSDGDFDADGVVAFSDFLILSGNYGATASRRAAEMTSVPEPQFGSMVCATLVACQFVRKRQAKTPSRRACRSRSQVETSQPNLFDTRGHHKC